MKKLSFGMLMVLFALSMGFLGCPTDADDDSPGTSVANEVGTGGTAGQTVTVTFKSNYLGVISDVADITKQVQYGESIGINLPSTGTVTFANPDRPRVNGFANVPTGRQFKEWNTKLDGSGITFTAKTKIKGNVTIYAIWEAKYNLSAQMYPNLLELKYNSYGGKDAEGVYNYQAIVPIAQFGGVPGKIASGKTFTVSLEMVACYNVGSAISFNLADASGTGAPKNLSNIISSGSKPLRGVKVELLNKALTSTAGAADFSPEASALLVSAELPIFTEKLPVYASVSMVQAAGAMSPSPEFSLDIANMQTGSYSQTVMMSFPGWDPFPMDVPDAAIAKNGDGSATITLGNSWGMAFSPGGFGGFTGPAFNLSNYSKVDIEYTAAATADPKFKLLSVAFNDTEGTDKINISASLPRSDTKRTETISLTGKDLSSVVSFAFQTLPDSGDGFPPTTPSSTMTVYSITFKN